MIILLPCKTEQQIDATGLDPFRVQIKVMEHNVSGTPVLVGFGRSPQFLASRGRIYKLVEVTPAQFRESLPVHEDQCDVSMWGEACGA